MNGHARSRAADLLGRRVTLQELLGPAAGRPVPPGRNPLPAQPPLLLSPRLGLGLACTALIVLGLGLTTVLPEGPELSDDLVAHTAVSIRSPALPLPAVVRAPRPHEYQRWAGPSGDYLTYIPEATGPGPFSEPTP